jgi:elongation factor G
MKEIEKTRNIGISAHIDSGKTTLSERILFYSKKIHKISEVHCQERGATMDYMDLEREKGITITSAATSIYWKNCKINLIDTPGHVDFTVEVERALHVLDGAIMVLCAVAGVQSQSVTVDRQMKRYSVPRLAFINKCDRVGADPDRVVREMREKLELNAVPIQIPLGLEDSIEGVIDLVAMKAYRNSGPNGEDLVEFDIPESYKEKANEAREHMLDALSQYDDELLEALLEERDYPESLLHRALKTGVLSNRMVPVLVGSAFKNKGVQKLMDAIALYLPSPLESTKKTAIDVKDETVCHELTPDDAKPLVCMAFKLTEEPYGQLTYTRIYQGTLEKGKKILNSRTGKPTRVNRLVRMHANDRENIDSASAGDIVAMIGVDCASGDTFCESGFVVSCESMYVADTVISMSIRARDNDSNLKLSKALTRFIREDPTFRVRTDEETSETIISGMGELHLEIYIERIRREYGADVEIGPPQVNYRESIQKTAPMEHIHKKQTGGAGQFAGVIGELFPLVDSEEKHFEFVNEVKGGNIPTEYIPSCEKGFLDALAKGPLAGFPMMNLGVRLQDGRYHPVDSSDMAFRICARDALKASVTRADPVILEPLMKVEIACPSEYQGDVSGSLFSRRGMISGTITHAGETVIQATVPLSEMFGYTTDLRSLTSGKASFTMEFERFAAVPKPIQARIIEKRRTEQASAR